MNMLKVILWSCLSLFATQVFALTAEPVAPVAGEKPAEAKLSVYNRDILTFRDTVLGITPEDRAKRAKTRIEQQLRNSGKHHASMIAVTNGMLIQIDNAGSFFIAPDDADQMQQETLDSVAKQALTNLNKVIEETAESRNIESMLWSAAYALLATILYVGLVWIVARLRHLAERRLLAFTNSKIDQLDVVSSQIVNRERIHWVLRRLLRALSWVVIALCTYEWLSIILAQFPITRPWGEQLNDYFIGVLMTIGNGILSAIPGFFTAAVIFFLANAVTKGLGNFFQRVQDKTIQIDWLDTDLAGPTRRIAIISVWLFALAMAYPYLPGAQTEAFKGLSVLVGLMISLGASGLVGQVASGLILTYARIYRKGEFIRIMEYEGSIMEMGMFTTRIRNGMGVELTLPNSLVLSNVTRNYSKAVHGEGYVVDTKVTIGYDTPWRQVHEMLVIAAARTPGVMTEPPPKVFQTALSDFYPEYLLICQAIPTEPRPRAEVINMLHANIQDVFNEYGVQIMSPHYLADPAKEKVVAKDDWYKAPANNKGN